MPGPLPGRIYNFHKITKMNELEELIKGSIIGCASESGIYVIIFAVYIIQQLLS